MTFVGAAMCVEEHTHRKAALAVVVIEPPSGQRGMSVDYRRAIRSLLWQVLGDCQNSMCV